MVNPLYSIVMTPILLPCFLFSMLVWSLLQPYNFATLIFSVPFLILWGVLGAKKSVLAFLLSLLSLSVFHAFITVSKALFFFRYRQLH